MARLKIWDAANNTWQYVDSTNANFNATSASYALTASYALNGGSGGGSSTSASWASSSISASAFVSTIFVNGSMIDGTQPYTLANTDDGKILSLSSSLAANVIVSGSILSPYFSVTIYQSGSGQLTYVSESNAATIRNRSGHIKSAGQFAVTSLIRINGREFVLTGDTTF